METTGGCYCKEIRYRASGEPLMRGQCHCRECQYLSGGNPNVIMGFSADGFEYTSGTVTVHKREGAEMPAHREFCPTCGTHILTRPAQMAGMVILKVGTLDDPRLFGQAEFAIQLADKQSFHQVPEGIPAFDRWME